MSVAVELLATRNLSYLQSKRASLSSSKSLCPSSSLRLERLLKPRGYRVAIEVPAVFTPKDLGIGIGFPSLQRRNSLNRSIVSFAASHEESHSEIEVDKENYGDELGAEESQEVWKETLASFKEQALKMQSVSQEAYDVYSKKAMVILKETSEQLKIKADKAKSDLAVLAKEVTEESKEFLSIAAQNSPEPVKEVVETFASSTDDLNDFSGIHDFHLGIPYGLLLSVGGFLSFMLMGSISAVRFGVILGGALLTLSILSLRSYKKGQPCTSVVKGQAGIAALIFLREIRLLFQFFLSWQKASILTFFSTVISGAMVAFFLYRINVNGKQNEGSDMGQGAEN
ncbi:protein FATTY ACID EXPORT 3, chloroplastic isoform X2 [Hevea brasiliensis]|uniref:protein FATTY ACID EXPORT 3, chloroplastic isoform X2 n=1 Tax=Hevea brasiliensis TaxID=3981 RepID=UPI0025E7EC63|nr:protein FATTY ACID EXPORT 3, chloroplastic isoform X2 [Hevea brasiliensis]